MISISFFVIQRNPQQAMKMIKAMWQKSKRDAHSSE
jgi:hypothetical protein